MIMGCKGNRGFQQWNAQLELTLNCVEPARKKLWNGVIIQQKFIGFVEIRRAKGWKILVLCLYLKYTNLLISPLNISKHKDILNDLLGGRGWWLVKGALVRGPFLFA